jgi:carboxyl-terminal processing protease
MRRNKHFLGLALSATALMGFSFAAGYGVRALIWAVQGRVPALAADLGTRESAYAGFPRIASRAGTETMVGHGQVFGEVMSRLRELFVEPLPSATTMSIGAVEGMVRDVDDPDTRVMAAQEWSALTDEQKGVYRGLGAVLAVRRYKGEDERTKVQITVVAPMPGSPAEKAGLQPGDRITSIDSHWIAPEHWLKRTLNMLTDEADFQFDPKMLNAERLTDEEREKPPTAEERKQRDDQIDRWRKSTDIESVLGTLTGSAEGEHTLIVERAGVSEPKTLKIQFGKTSVAPIAKKKLAPAVGYVQVRQINADAVKALDQALAEFKASGLKSLVLDLRHSPGGPLTQAQEMASRFLTSGNVAVIEKRDSARKLVKKPLAVKPGERRTKFSPIAVLVDGGTSGTSEVLAAALRDAGLAKLVGATTFGDGTEQTVFPLENGAALSITTAKMFTRNGTDYDTKGLKPDVAVAASAGADRALDQALHLVRPS